MEALTTIHFQNQQKDFSSLIKALVERFKPEKIYCFGKNTVFNSKSNCFMENDTEIQCHYFLLVVTESVARIEHEIQHYANTVFTAGTVTILAHGKQTISEALNSNNRFFNTVYSSAPIVYSRDGILEREAIQPFIPTQAGVKALKHFNLRMEMADGFLAGANECLIEGQFNVCVFMLHQAVEQVCIALIKVHLAYRTDVHNLHRLLRLCSCFSDIPSKMLFLSGVKNDLKLFDVLVESYSAARYKDNFTVAEGDAHALFNKVNAFVPIAKEMCTQKIAELDQQAQTYKQLKKENVAQYD